MKNYRITVNGNVYDVAVEETEQEQHLLHLQQHQRQLRKLHLQQHRRQQPEHRAE